MQAKDLIHIFHRQTFRYARDSFFRGAAAEILLFEIKYFTESKKSE